jgi:hypothetical protein
MQVCTSNESFTKKCFSFEHFLNLIKTCQRKRNVKGNKVARTILGLYYGTARQLSEMQSGIFTSTFCFFPTFLYYIFFFIFCAVPGLFVTKLVFNSPLDFLGESTKLVY